MTPIVSVRFIDNIELDVVIKDKVPKIMFSLLQYWLHDYEHRLCGNTIREIEINTKYMVLKKLKHMVDMGDLVYNSFDDAWDVSFKYGPRHVIFRGKYD